MPNNPPPPTPAALTAEERDAIDRLRKHVRSYLQRFPDGLGDETNRLVLSAVEKLLPYAPPPEPPGFRHFYDPPVTDQSPQPFVGGASAHSEAGQQMHSWEYRTRGREAWWQCVECDQVFLDTGRKAVPPTFGCTWRKVPK